MALDAEELAAVRNMEILRGFKYARKGVLIVVLLRPPPNPDMPTMVAAFPRKALMNLVSDLCTSRYRAASAVPEQYGLEKPISVSQSREFTDGVQRGGRHDGNLTLT